MTSEIKHLVIVGGGSAGWMAAAMLSRMMGRQLKITLVESDQIATVGVGEASIPPLQLFNRALGINEHDFLRATQGTYKLGIEFEHWLKQDQAYMHAFGTQGKDLALTPFRHLWLKSKPESASDYWRYSLNYQAAKANRFQPLAQLPGTDLPGINHAYHFDAGLYGKQLAHYSQQNGVNRKEGKITRVLLDGDSGDIDCLELENGERIRGDLYLDCSGFHGLLIKQALNVEYLDYRQWLLCDRAIAMPTMATRPRRPYTRASAHKAGWCWQIPLQNRTGNGIVYSSQYMSDDEALSLLEKHVDSAPIGEPRKIQFIPGRVANQWHKNCVSLGLSSGFLEPLESTSLHLIQSGIIRLLKLFPNPLNMDALRDEYNRQSAEEFEQIRDFIILHYKLNQRDNDEFWQHCREMSVPDTLTAKMALFSASGVIDCPQESLFSENAWTQVMLGQGLMPASAHPLASALTTEQTTELLHNLNRIITKTTDAMASHDDYLKQHCAAQSE
ncbi:tryptophan halogenase family protein [Shewanella sp. Isolate8]|uniref:tryptophan halogenase family protein n=1 Tax=Shewanella sp. Isolate8 TaxID=2908529 RepID=UPI001EFE0264|nr:tryptophan halogenase family protein [Shewanella sp. Isolate8]MCG9746407.1 tryptophan 7-halogenase [Shewanella sp. Isolate8]